MSEGKYITWRGMLLCLVLALVFVSLFSYGTSPFYTNHASSDSAMFQVIGRGWAEGRLPYADLWDSKGPLIFFINAVGFWLTGSATGVYLLQIASLTFTFVFAYAWISRYMGCRAAVFTCLLLFLALPLNYDFGNMTEEYLLPLLMLSFSYVYRWSDSAYSSGRMEHPARWAFVYGLLLGCSLMTRLTNAIGICVAVAFIAVCLMRKGLWRCLMRNAAMFAAGFAVVVLPFVVYFGSKGVLDEMWYATFEYNVMYASHSVSTVRRTILSNGLFSSFNSLLLIGVILLAVMRTKKITLHTLLWLLISSVTVVYLAILLGFAHYSMICLPYICAAMLITQRYLDIRRVSIKVCILVVIALFSVFFAIKTSFAITSKDKFVDDCIAIVSSIPAKERCLLTGYNCDAGIYMWLDVRPVYRFFMFQDWAVSHDRQLAEKMKKEYSECKAKYILFGENPYETQVADIMRARYELVKYNSTSNLWLLKRR